MDVHWELGRWQYNNRSRSEEWVRGERENLRVGPLQTCRVPLRAGDGVTRPSETYSTSDQDIDPSKDPSEGRIHRAEDSRVTGIVFNLDIDPSDRKQITITEVQSLGKRGGTYSTGNPSLQYCCLH